MSDNFRFAAVMSMINFGYKICLCVFRRMLKNKIDHPDKVAAPLAGFVSGLLIGLDDVTRRKFMTSIILARITDILA